MRSVIDGKRDFAWVRVPARWGESVRSPPAWPLEVFDDVALDGYIRATSYVRAIAPPGSALVPLGEKLLKDRQNRQIQQFTVRYGAVHLRHVHRGTTCKRGDKQGRGLSQRHSTRWMLLRYIRAKIQHARRCISFTLEGERSKHTFRHGVQIDVTSMYITAFPLRRAFRTRIMKVWIFREARLGNYPMHSISRILI